MPPEVVAHPVADQFCAPAKFQYTVLVAGKVMFRLFPQLPPRVGDFAFVSEMSLKSISETVVHVVAFSVLRVPGVSEQRKYLLVTEAPDRTRVVTV